MSGGGQEVDVSRMIVNETEEEIELPRKDRFGNEISSGPRTAHRITFRDEVLTDGVIHSV